MRPAREEAVIVSESWDASVGWTLSGGGTSINRGAERARTDLPCHVSVLPFRRRREQPAVRSQREVQHARF